MTQSELKALEALTAAYRAAAKDPRHKRLQRAIYDAQADAIDNAIDMLARLGFARAQSPRGE